MKIAASDFDGTLYHEGKGISEKTLSAIKKWQAAQQDTSSDWSRDGICIW